MLKRVSADFHAHLALPTYTILVRGQSGTGKFALTRKAIKTLGLHVVLVDRLQQLQGGTTILPTVFVVQDVQDMSAKTTAGLVKWLKTGHRKRVVLLMTETLPGRLSHTLVGLSTFSAETSRMKIGKRSLSMAHLRGEKKHDILSAADPVPLNLTRGLQQWQRGAYPLSTLRDRFGGSVVPLVKSNLVATATTIEQAAEIADLVSTVDGLEFTVPTVITDTLLTGGIGPVPWQYSVGPRAKLPIRSYSAIKSIGELWSQESRGLLDSASFRDRWAALPSVTTDLIRPNFFPPGWGGKTHAQRAKLEASIVHHML